MAGPTHDVVVIGGGHNGLACAAYLARAGLDVLVLERREVLGGAAVTEEPWPGYRVSSASYVVSLMPPRIVNELGLRRFGYRVSILEPDYRVPYPDGSSRDPVNASALPRVQVSAAVTTSQNRVKSLSSSG